MPRRPRYDLPGIPQHVIQRGVDRQPVFFSDDDRLVYLDWLDEYARKRRPACLLPDDQPRPSTAFRNVGGDVGRLDAGYRPTLRAVCHRTYHRSGGLWQGRYQSSYVQSERYLLACMRYVELNPVRANLVKTPGEYRWSSYRTNALGEADKLVTQHSEYLTLGASPEARQQAFRELFVSEIDEPAWLLIHAATQQGVLVADSRFAERVSQRLGQVLTPRPRGRPPAKYNR